MDFPVLILAMDLERQRRVGLDGDFGQVLIGKQIPLISLDEQRETPVVRTLVDHTV